MEEELISQVLVALPFDVLDNQGQRQADRATKTSPGHHYGVAPGEAVANPCQDGAENANYDTPRK